MWAPGGTQVFRPAAINRAVAATLMAVAASLGGPPAARAADGQANDAGNGSVKVIAPSVLPTPVAASAPARPQPPAIAAKVLFGAAKTAAPMAARAIGSYARGCLAGGKRLPIDGPEWQAMRLERNRNWGTPELVSFLERFASDVRRLDGWPGLLIGDMSQPRGGPMASLHASHQIGLDVDIWYTPMPDHRLTRQQREDISASNLVRADKRAVDPSIWTSDYVLLLKRAASFGEVERIFVHPAIKQALCEATATSPDRTWLHKVRPIWGHDDHFHVRIRCPDGIVGCQPQPPPGAEDGCGKEVADWIALVTRPDDPTAPSKPPPPPLTLDKMPADCRDVLAAPSKAVAGAAQKGP